MILKLVAEGDEKVGSPSLGKKTERRQEGTSPGELQSSLLGNRGAEWDPEGGVCRAGAEQPREAFAGLLHRPRA